ncbi:hypothetical protein E4T56_gene1324 [Termitomyces sp. T112]|nr:hypothetical protein E4T56_gene1324 [Termitomyces sp. T112]
MSPCTEVLFQQLYNTENSVLVSALRGDLSDLQARVKELKSLWKQFSQAKDKQFVPEARKSFSNKALQILLGKLAKATLSTGSFPPALAPTLAPIAEAEEPNNDEAAQPKKDESEMDCTTAVATTFD